MHNGIVNKTRYDDPGKPIKQISFTVKNLGGTFSYYSKEKFQIWYDFTIPVDELIAKTFYCFRTFEFFNI